ncbi:3-carboxy-cis,cis-muconate cycloisomerase [uncultured Agrobacterium sp.]|uniref:3-carboxy-cis,cis-muconate cycloisomerase n=1 Tax=uncultured Agrobacterium sp. TaxID=157277 RepID=UPI0025D25F0E|nr:3-carboxy-cis,cis-muconate cycloisomerase [uncultured Agrobacterium sp.]
MSLSPFDHPFLSGLFGDAEIAALFSAEADIAAMIRFERALALAEADCGILAVDIAQTIDAALGSFVPDMAGLAEGTARDGVVVPALIRQMRGAVGGAAAEKVHFGATSQDVIDTSLMVRLKAANDIIKARLGEVIGDLDALLKSDGDKPLMAHTRMQAAIEIKAADRIGAWRSPLERTQSRLALFATDGFTVQFGGAAGTLERFGNDGPALRAALSARLGLHDRGQWHSQRDMIAEFAGLLSLVTGSLGKIGQDIALLAQAGTEISLAGGGGSSAMPHKQNPVAAELLVTLARFNATQVSALHQSLVHEQERSGAAWMLEWMTLPPMVLATASALRTARRLLGDIRRIGREPGENKGITAEE